MSLPPAVIFDVDGTLADVTGIRHYLLADPGKKNFPAFHAAASFVHPNPHVFELARALDSRGIVVLVVTARREMWRYRTSAWLRKWGSPHQWLFMRPDADNRPDYEVKRDILARIRTRYEVVLAVDDNPAVIALWQEENVPAVIVPGWDHKV